MCGQDDVVKADEWVSIILPLLGEGHLFKIEPKGMSMFPFLISGRDSAILKKADAKDLKRGDIVLYRRPNAQYILHRIIKKDAKGFYIIGDNQTWIEGPVPRNQIVAVADQIIRNGKRISCQNKSYRFWIQVWLLLRPVRPLITRCRVWIYNKFQR